MRRLGIGEAGEIVAKPQKRDAAGSWVTAASARQSVRWRARVYVRGHDGARREVTRFAPTRRAAEAAAQEAVDEILAADAPLLPSTPLLDAGTHWLAQIDRPESGLSDNTRRDYRAAWNSHVVPGSLRGLTLAQANNPQRIRAFLQHVADTKGSGAAKKTKSVLSSLLTYAVENGVLDHNAVRQVRPVKAAVPRESERDTTRAFTRAERDHVIATADARAAEPGLNPRTRRTRQATADLVAFLAGTGVRIDEARRTRWEDVDLATGRVRIHGTKSETSDRWLDLPAWLLTRLTRRAEEIGREGLIFASPAHLGQPEKPWDRSNSSGAVRVVLDAAKCSWAIPHTFRRTVATLLDESGVPIARIADQLGHADVAMTARVYLGRDLKGSKADLAELL